MSVKRKCKVVMLPTNEKANIYTDRYGNLKLHSTPSKLPINSIGSNQHLYVTSDNEIKEGDRCYDISNNNIFTFHKDTYYKSIDFKKIIATTNSSLTIQYQTSQGNLYNEPLPQPSQQFIEKYVEAYNNGNPITGVMVEYEEVLVTDMIIEGADKFVDVLKVNPKDNTITIKKVKDNWNREEVIAFAKKYADRCQAPIQAGDQWIEENL